jgi:hypothetical protein
MVISDLLGPFRDAMTLRNERTRRAYLADLRAVCAWYETSYGAPLTLDALTPDAVSRYRHWCRVRVRAGTFNRRKAALAFFCGWAVREGLLPSSVVKGVACLKP